VVANETYAESTADWHDSTLAARQYLGYEMSKQATGDLDDGEWVVA
jgi:hypothetical protein